MAALWDIVYSAHVGMSNPKKIDYEHIYNGAIVTLSAFFLLGLFDFLVARRFAKRYMALHVFANAVISALVTGPSSGEFGFGSSCT